MFFTAIAGVVTVATGWYMIGAFGSDDSSGGGFRIVPAKNFRKDQELIRRRKVVVTAEEMRRIDPTFIMPGIVSNGEPDI